MAAVSPTMLAVLIVGVLGLVLGIILGMYSMPVTMSPELDSKLSIVRRLTRDYYPAHNEHDPVYRAIIDQTSAANIERNLKFLSVEPHQAGSERDVRLAEFVKESFLEAGLDRAYLAPYKVLLSYANPTRPNKVYLMNKATKEPLIVSSHVEAPMHASDMHPKQVPAYHSFSPKGDVEGVPVYCNFGRVMDFELLIDEAGIDLHDKICIVRYGKIYRGNKVKNAARFGCAAVVMYSDPEQVAPKDQRPEAVYPNSMWMNGKAMQRGDVRIANGDSLTPGFAADPEGFRLNKEDADMPSIPSQPIGYDDAKAILQEMAGKSTQDDQHFHNWAGALNITYRLGPGFADELKLRLVVNNELSEKIIYNVVGVLDGHLEPDRFVIMGNHRDAWGFGALDAASGGAAMLETARVIGEYHNRTGWRPRRSIIFASWSGEEQGLIGSTEWVEDLRHILSAKTVAYLNVDSCVNGPALGPDISPSLIDMFEEVIHRIPSHPFPGMPNKKNVTLYDNMMKYSYDNATKSVKINSLASGSDHVSFSFYAGIPSINLEFDLPKGEYPSALQPAYHSNYDTFLLVKKFVDPDFSIHQACSRLASTLLYSLSCSTLVPIKLADLAARIHLDLKHSRLPDKLKKHSSIDHEKIIDRLKVAVEDFHKTTNEWQTRVDKLNKTGDLRKDAYLLRSTNDVLMSVERTFTDNSGRALEGRPQARNLLYGTPQQDFYTTLLFPGLHDLVNELKLEKASRMSTHDELNRATDKIKQINQNIERHANDIVLAFKVATRLLRSHVI